MANSFDGCDFPLNANGQAYTSRQERHGVPLSYVGEKLRHGIEELHRAAKLSPTGADDLLPSMHYLLVSYLGLFNMLGKADDRSLPKRLLDGSKEQLSAWLALVEREGDVNGLADIGEPA